MSYSLNWYQKAILFFFHLLVLTVPLYFSFNTEELFEFNKMLLVYGFTILIGSTWLLRMAAEKKIIFKRTVLDIPLAIFLLSQIAATIFSMHPRTSMLGYYSRFHGGLLSTLSYYTLYYAFVSNIPLKAAYRLLYTSFISASLVAVYGILEHFGNSMSCYLISDGKQFGVDCWVQKVQERVFATFGQPNWLAAYAITLIPAGIYISGRKKSPMPWRLISGTAAVLLFTALLFTKSRSGVLGFGISMLLMAAAMGISYLNIKNRSLKKFMLSSYTTAFAGFLAIAFVLTAFFGSPYTPSINDLTQNQDQVVEETTEVPVNRLEVGGTESSEIRKIVWEGAIKVWQRYPFFGSGVETFAYSYYQDRPVEHNMVSEWDFLYNKAHNEFLNYLATTGLFGLLSYILLLGWFSITAIKIWLKGLSKKSLANKQAFSAALLSAIAALSVSNFFGFSTVMVSVLMFLFFALVALLYEETNEGRASNAENPNKPAKNSLKQAWQFGISSLIVLFALFMLAKLVNYRQADVAFSRGKSYISAGQTQAGLASLHNAVERSPNEALFYDELSEVYARLAVASAEQNQATQAAQLTSTAISFSDQALLLNPVHRNFYKTRARIFITLAQLDLTFLAEARDTLSQAIERSPTDAKLWYNLGLVESSLENSEQAAEAFKTAVELKPDYQNARLQLANQYAVMGKIEEAREQYNLLLEISPDHPAVLEALERLQTATGAAGTAN